MSLGKRIKLLLFHADNTQKNLANYCNMTETKVSRIVNDKAEPTLEQLEYIAKFFNLTIDELMGKCRLLDELLLDYETRFTD